VDLVSYLAGTIVLDKLNISVPCMVWLIWKAHWIYYLLGIWLQQDVVYEMHPDPILKESKLMTDS